MESTLHSAARQSATQDRPIYNAFGRRMAQVRYVIEARAKDPICRYVSRAGFISYHHKNAAKYKTAAEAESDREYFAPLYPQYRLTVDRE